MCHTGFAVDKKDHSDMQEVSKILWINTSRISVIIIYVNQTFAVSKVQQVNQEQSVKTQKSFNFCTRFPPNI